MITRLRPEGRRRQDDARVQPRGRDRPARPADRPDRRQPPVRRPAGAAQGAGRRAVDPRPADRPDRRSRTSPDVLWRDPSGIDILLAPPRVEMAEMVTARDLDKVLSLLRRVYEVVDRRHAVGRQRHQPRVPRPVGHDPRDRHLRLDDDPQHDGHGRRVPDDRLPAHEGPLPRQPRRLLGRHRPRRPRSGRSAACRSTASSRTARSSSSPTTRASRSSSRTRRPRSARTSCGSRPSCVGPAPPPRRARR